VTNPEIYEATIGTDQFRSTTTVYFILSGESFTTSVVNVTIPKSAVLYGITPTVYNNNLPTQGQGYTQDSINYYVWFTTYFTTHQVSITFTEASSSSQPQEVISGIAVALSIVIIVPVIAYVKKYKDSISLGGWLKVKIEDQKMLVLLSGFLGILGCATLYFFNIISPLIMLVTFLVVVFMLALVYVEFFRNTNSSHRDEL